MLRFAVIFGAAAGFVAVALGAFAAHGLKARLDPQALGWIETGVRYQMWHALAMLAGAGLIAAQPGKGLTVAVGAWAVGIVLFSGSLYLLALTGARAVAFVTPFGGVAFLAGWAAALWYGIAALRK
jgi:uncharacterized membrane protein YgdD (TMEM256/DUF423 family)